MIPIQPSTSQERKLLFLETLVNTAINDDGTSRVSKVSEHSATSGLAGGVAKVAGKAEKDIALAVSQLFPDLANNNKLDQVADNFGIGRRYGALGSSTYMRLVGDINTQYLANTHYFTSSNGTRFELEEDHTIGADGFLYAKIRSLTTGSRANVDALSISKCAPQPSGHQNCVNEYMAMGGRDIESDQIFRTRIKNGANFVATGTLAMLEQRCIAINNKVLRLIHCGTQIDGKIAIAVVTENGVALTESELNQLLDETAIHFSLNELRPHGTKFTGLRYTNIETQPVDISFRADLDPSYNPDEIRKQIQVAVSKYFDHRYFDTYVNQVQWDKLLQIVQSIPGVLYVPDQYFYPRTDLTIDTFALPRLRSFLMLNLQGQVISNLNNTLSPIYYPNVVDESFHRTVLNL